MKLKVGMKIYMLNDNNKKALEERIIEKEIIEVGRKYFYTGTNWFDKYEINTMTTVDYRSKKVFLSKQELFDNEEKQELKFDIYQFMNQTRKLDKLSLGQLRRIKNILQESESK